MTNNVALHIAPLQRITERSGLEGTSVGHPAQPPCWSRVTQSRLHRTLSRWVWNISREGDSTMLQCGADAALLLPCCCMGAFTPPWCPLNTTWELNTDVEAAFWGVRLHPGSTMCSNPARACTAAQESRRSRRALGYHWEPLFKHHADNTAREHRNFFFQNYYSWAWGTDPDGFKICQEITLQYSVGKLFLPLTSKP